MAAIVSILLELPGAAAHGLFTINQPWASPGMKATDAYMVLTSTDGGTLIGVHSSVAARVGMIDGAKRPLSRLSLPAGKAVTLRPGAKRFRLSGLSRPLRLGERIPLVLTVESADGVRSEISVDAEVRNESPVDAELRAHRR